MKKQYEILFLELIPMDSADVIITSETSVGWDDDWNIFT